MKNDPTPTNPDIDLAKLRTLIEYDPDSGDFTHIKTRNSVTVGQQCGWIEKNGYVRLRVGKHKILAHRLAWLFMTGHWPSGIIDHADRNRSNNSWSNLRLATARQNAMNAKLQKNNTSGCAGVTWRKHLSRWQATIRISGERVSLGHFAELPDAIAARRAAEEMHYGEFRAVQVAVETERAA